MLLTYILEMACEQQLTQIFFFFFIWIISLILSRVNRKVGRKREIPKKKHLTTRKQNLACLTYDPS